MAGALLCSRGGREASSRFTTGRHPGGAWGPVTGCGRCQGSAEKPPRPPSRFGMKLGVSPLLGPSVQGLPASPLSLGSSAAAALGP